MKQNKGGRGLFFTERYGWVRRSAENGGMTREESRGDRSGLFHAFRPDELQEFFLFPAVGNVEPAVKYHQSRRPAGTYPQIGKCPVGLDPEQAFFCIQLDFHGRIRQRHFRLFQRQSDRTRLQTNLENFDLRKPR